MIEYTKRSTYKYDLPEELIAQKPLEKRDNSRLLVFNRKNNIIEHKHFYDLPNYLKKGDVLVVNKSRVIPARLFGVKVDTGAKIEILLQKRINLHRWDIIAKPFKRLKVGTEIKFSDELSCKVVEKKEYGECIIDFNFEGRFEEILDKIGTMPLPHYIREKLNNKERYQTVYAKEEGSSAAPTAGLHFTPELLQKIKDLGVEVVEVILHVGLGTFRPVKEDDIKNHDMHSEYYELSKENAEIINSAKKENRRIIAVGTTSVRVLETCGNIDGTVSPGYGETKIFIYPPYKFKIVDGLITNFHLPESTLIMLVSAFAGLENTLNNYKVAVDNKYRFFSFGDANLIIWGNYEF